MKLLILADMDEFEWEPGRGQADVLLACGDLADSLILEAAAAYRCSCIFAVKGNHDIIAPFPEPIVDLHLQVREQSGIRFGGMNGSWKYKPRGFFLHTQEEAQTLLAGFPPVDVFISHNSPRRIHDREDGIHYGFEGLTAYIQRAKPKLLIHGHLHIDQETQIADTKVIGVYGHRLIEI